MLMLFLILCMLGLGHFGLGARANLIIAIVLVVIGAFLAFTGFSASFNVDVD